MVRGRLLTQAERALASSVYAGTLPFDRIYITDLDLGSAVTLVGRHSLSEPFVYTINWVEAFGGVMAFAGRRSTLVHELCHVWQGENGIWPTVYIVQSGWAQLVSGLNDIWNKREWRGWGEHRSTAYPFSVGSIGKDWSTFNVEQQASIVESWYMPEQERVVSIGSGRFRVHDFGPGVRGGGGSELDARFPYIRDVIRARNRNASYRSTSPSKDGEV